MIPALNRFLITVDHKLYSYFQAIFSDGPIESDTPDNPRLRPNLFSRPDKVLTLPDSI